MDPSTQTRFGRFSTELPVRPDDIDMNQHVHASKYFDYVLAARYDQMRRCYLMAMEEFVKLGYAWYVRSASIEYKRPLRLGDQMRVTTWVERIEGESVTVGFEIAKAAVNKIAAEGRCVYTLVQSATGRSEPIPDWIRAKYSV